MKTPNFFIVGAPKCGTTSLHAYLKQHPDIFMPEVKEPHFFGSDLYNPHFLRDRKNYLELFQKADKESKLGESSVFYLYSKKAAREIFQFCPNARIIIMLRNPVDVMYSYHSQRLYNGTENIFDFEQAFRAVEKRRNGQLLPKDPHPIFGLYYDEIVQFSTQVTRYLNVFPKDQVQIILFDDFKNSSKTVYREVLEFLGVDSTFQADLKPKNANKTFRSAWLRDLIFRPSALEQTIARSIFPKYLRKKIAKLIIQVNNRQVSRPPLRPEFRRELELKCLADIEKLEDLLNCTNPILLKREHGA